jgi:DNA-binding NtrC family response regulator
VERLESENERLRASISIEHDMVGRGSAMQELLQLIGRVAPTNLTVLITGESGTGKELVAEALHKASKRNPHPLVKVSCAALPETLLETELFGHEKGSFTGAMTMRKGRFETANKGTIFLDEIGEMTLATQTKLLRILQEREFERIGSNVPIKIDIRVITATNRNLAEEVDKGRFREDLYYRLNVIHIDMPPLRERKEDIPLLVEHFLVKYRHAPGAIPTTISEEALERLVEYDWPGNVRELRNVIERAMLLSDRDRLDAGDFSGLAGAHSAGDRIELPAKGIDLEELERSLVTQALRRCGGNQTRAGALLGLNRDQIRYRIEKFALTTAQ